ncbi:MAG: FtsX-like permease family protein [Clostridia bacterium]|nr:FtsX-like permease family protein [Clostridia bacterium]
MHIGQAIKMAFKSLWTNKLRSFLTMLGIIIGVVTVTLLTTVAQGVSDAVVSSIRSQSTLSIIMNTSNKMTYSSLSNVLKSQQPNKADDNYYEYSMILNSSVIYSDEIAGLDTSRKYTLNEVKDYIRQESILSEEYSTEKYNSLTDIQKIVYMTQLAKKRARAISTSVYAVDKNFTDVYDLTFDGKFPENTDEIIVDEIFKTSFYGEDIKNSDVIGSKVIFGSKYYTELKLNFNEDISASELEKVCEYITGNYEITVGEDTKNVGLYFTIIPNDDESLYTYDAASHLMTVNVEYFTTMKSEELNTQKFIACTEVNGKFSDVNPITITDYFDFSASKLYTVVGVLTGDNSLFTGMATTSGQSENSLSSVMFSSRKGECYMLLDNSNLSPLGQTSTEVNNTIVNYAYLRYKTEDVMTDSTSNLTVAMIQAGYGYMTDFMIISLNSVAKIIAQVMSILTTMLTVIAVISLIVGGIGIMNIMLVAVTERTREIGVRKAIGAKRASILMQFLIEALMLSLIGGLIGLGISAIGTAIIGHVMGFAMNIPLWVIAMSLGFCTAIGLIFGMFPAVKASHMQPIDALRRE